MWNSRPRGRMQPVRWHEEIWHTWSDFLLEKICLLLSATFFKWLNMKSTWTQCHRHVSSVRVKLMRTRRSAVWVCYIWTHWQQQRCHVCVFDSSMKGFSEVCRFVFLYNIRNIKTKTKLDFLEYLWEFPCLVCITWTLKWAHMRPQRLQWLTARLRSDPWSTRLFLKKI